jgi:hypothetical protein
MVTIKEPATKPSCPRCQQPNTKWLEFTSAINNSDAYQCLACGLLWTVSRIPPPDQK